MHIQKKLFYMILALGIFQITSCTRIRISEPASIQTGMASWYGTDFHGKPTSNLEVYNMYDLTAAHRTLPFGTWVMVTNLKNGKTVTVRINDRGPFVEGRIIDLSYAAANVIDAVKPGIVPVRLEVLSDMSPPKASQKFVVQAGSFISEKNAMLLKSELKKRYKGVYVMTYKTTHQAYYRVRIKARNLEEAENIVRRLASEGVASYVIEL